MVDSLGTFTQLLRGRYNILRELGRGGMATVYLAHDVRHGREVALKVLRPELGVGADRFLQEIRVAAGLRHPHILPLHDSGNAGDLLFYVMPYVSGPSLENRLAHGGPLAASEALIIGAEVAEGLDYAHRQGVIHRDIKPANILLEEGHAVVADFGIARAVREAGDARLTYAGDVVGTPAYMSPEQIAGEENLDGRSDLYSLGCVLFEALSGSPPFRGSNPLAVMSARLTSTPPHLHLVASHISPEIDRVVMNAMSLEPSHRFATGLEMAAALRGLASTTAVSFFTPASGPAPASIAVLPFANLSADRENEYFADGITEEIINALAKLDGLRVASRTSAFSFKGQDVDARRIGDQLNVSNLLEGSVRKSANRLRVTAQLISVRDGYHLWSERFDRELHDVFAIQDEIAQAIVGTLKVKLGRTSDPRIVKAHTANLAAYNLFLEGRYHWNRRGTGLFKAATCFSRAVELDTNFALAHSSLADAYNLIGWYRMEPPAVAFPKATASALRALELDATLPEAHTSLAFARMYFDWEWRDAEHEFQLALAANPGYATAHHWYAEFLMSQGRTADAVEEARKAQDLDPLGLIINTVRGMAHYFDRDFHAAVSECRRTLAMDPAFTPVMIWLGLSHMGIGEYQKAVEVFEEERRLNGEFCCTDGFRGVALARAGRAAEAEGVLSELRKSAEKRYVAAYDTMLIENALGRLDATLADLRRAVNERSVWLAWIGQDPLLDDLRNLPEFKEVAIAVSRGRRQVKVVTPISMDDVRTARERIAPYLPPSALREYAELNEFVGAGIRVLVKHENQLPTNAFKVRNGLAAMTALQDSDRSHGVVCGTRGNHGLGVAYAGRELGVPVTVVVPYGNNPEKNSAMRGLGARVMECGANYDEAVAESERLAREEGMILVHSTNNRDVIAGAATLTLEILEQASDLDAMVIAVGGGSQAVGAITVLQSLRPAVSVYAVQAAGAPTIYESWKAGKPVEPTPPMTIADGVATGHSYALTFPTLRDGLTGFVLATEEEIIEATRAMTRCTHNLTEPAGGVGLAGLRKLRADLDGKIVCVILSGSNADEATLKLLWSN